MENSDSQLQTKLIDLGDARIQKLIGQANSANGYEREAAVIKIKQLGAPLLLPTLIRRANDWVPNVSIHATDALIGLLKTENKAYIIQAIPDILHLAKCGRRDHSHLINAVLEFFIAPDQRASLINAIHHKNPKVSLIAFRLCRKHNLVPLHTLLMLAIKSSNIAVIRGATHIISEIEDSNFLSLYPQLIKHKCNAVASTSIKRLNLLAPQEVNKISADLIFSPDAKVRAIAKDYLGRDVISIYRRHLNDISVPLHKRRIALIGIHETDRESAINDLMQAKTYNEPSLRSIAISRLVEMLEIEGRSIAINGILDESSSVARESARAIVKQGFQLSVEELLQFEQTGKASNRFDVIMFLAKKGNKWNHLALLLELIPRKPGQEKLIHIALGQWFERFNFRQIQPTKEQVQKIKTLHSLYFHSPNNQYWESLKFIIDTLSF